MNNGLKIILLAVLSISAKEGYVALADNPQAVNNAMMEVQAQAKSGWMWFSSQNVPIKASIFVLAVVQLGLAGMHIFDAVSGRSQEKRMGAVSKFKQKIDKNGLTVFDLVWELFNVPAYLVAGMALLGARQVVLPLKNMLRAAIMTPILKPSKDPAPDDHGDIDNSRSMC